ncbi:MAG: SDR family oxidoreductase [Breznakibacter sp.]
MILVTGATGHYGKEVMDFLLKKTPAENVAAIARNPDKLNTYKAIGVSVRKAEYDDSGSLLNAFKGVDTLLFVSGNEIGKRIPQHTNVVNAARKAGVKHILYTSFQRKSESSNSPIALIAQDHIETERLILASGMDYTILKHSLYLDALPMFLGPNVADTGIFLPAGNGKGSFALRADMAEAAANILTSEGHRNKVYEIASPASYSFTDIANQISVITGKSVSYTSPTEEAFTDALAKSGVPAGTIGFSLGFAKAIAAGEFDCPSPTLRQLLGREPVSPEQFLKQILK